MTSRHPQFNVQDPDEYGTGVFPGSPFMISMSEKALDYWDSRTFDVEGAISQNPVSG
jgi:hypothetical protein